MAEKVGVLGAASLVGECLLTLLCRSEYEVAAFSRRERLTSEESVLWHGTEEREWPRLASWICIAPIWVLPDYFDRLHELGARRIVVLSSTSCLTKIGSSDVAERVTAKRLADGESRLRKWAEMNSIEWVILRSTLIYGLGCDRNISEIARFVRRFGFFPVSGQAKGLRQPIHAGDVAAACVAALKSPEAANCAYNISGGETLPYREMVNRIFSAFHRRPRLVRIPLPVFRLMAACLRFSPRFRHWSAAMAERMNRDLVFDHAAAKRDLDFTPRLFRLDEEDLPR